MASLKRLVERFHNNFCCDSPDLTFDLKRLYWDACEKLLQSGEEGLEAISNFLESNPQQDYLVKVAFDSLVYQIRSKMEEEENVF